MKKFGGNMQPQPYRGMGFGQPAYGQRMPPGNQFMNQAQPFMGNQDLMYDDDYYDEELDPHEEAAYQEALRMQGLQQPGMLNQQDLAIQRAEQMLGDGFEIMEEELDEDYEPTNDEIEEYAKYLGMDLNDDKDLFYIAKEGLKAPLPNPWKPCKSPGGNIYYFNFQSQELQKEHPCDNYYKDYYKREKSNQIRKKEEQVIKKQIKEEKKKQKLSTSMNSTNQNPTNQSGMNTSINQMAMMMNMSALDVSNASYLNEQIQLEVEKLMDDYEEKKIQHERKRRDELKKYENDKAYEKKSIESDYKLRVEVLKKSQTTASPQDLVTRKKAELQLEKDKRMRELREQERAKQQKQEKQAENKFEKRRDDFKREEEIRHKMEADNLKQLYANKIEIERDKIREENNRLLEESGDIDFQVRQLKSDLLDNQIDSQKYELEQEMRQKIKEAKEDNKRRLQKERERIQLAFEAKLDKEREKEQRRLKLELSKLEDKKSDIQKQHNLKLKDAKKEAEKGNLEKVRQRRMEADDELDIAKSELKKQLVATQQAREERIDREIDQVKKDFRAQQEKYEREKKAKYQENREEIDREELESKEQKLQKELKQLQKDISDLELEKRGKDRQLKSQSVQGSQDDLEIRQLQRELREKENELDRVKLMISDKKEELRRKTKQEGMMPGEDYYRLQKDLDQVKVMIMEIKSGQATGFQLKQSPYRRIARKPLDIDYSLSEIEAFIEINLPKAKHKLEKQDNDRVILRQLLSNIERNRMKLRKDLASANLSSTSRISMQSIKEKIDEQAMIIEQEEAQIKEKCDFYRRQEEKLRSIKHKIDLIRDDTLDEDRRDGLMKEVQIEYDKYLKLYQKDEITSKSRKSELRQKDLQAFQGKWADYLIDEASEDLKSIIGLDPTRELFKPKSLYRQYEMSSSKYHTNLAINHIYDREVERVRENRSQIKTFLMDQQKWLSQMRAELTVGKGAVPQSRSIHYVPSSETLFHLRNNLSPVLRQY